MIAFQAESYTFELAIGDVFAGWQFEGIASNGGPAEIQDLTCRFSKGVTKLSIRNAGWPGEKGSCFNSATGAVQKCPDELLLFSYRTLRIVDRQTAQGES